MSTYIVRENDCGYMPDSEPEEFTTLQDAKDYAHSLKREWRDLMWEDQPYHGLHITVWFPLKKIRKSDTLGGIVYASLDTPIDRVIVITLKDWQD